MQQGFRSWGKELPEEVARQICTSVQLHPSYVQQLAWLTLLNTQQVASEETLQLGIDDLINENAALFIQQTEYARSMQPMCKKNALENKFSLIFLAHMHFLLYLCTRNQMKTAKTLHFDFISVGVSFSVSFVYACNGPFL